MSKINVRESLRNIDADSCCKYDLLTMYDACPLTDEDKAYIAKLLFDNEDPEVIYQKLCTYFCDDDVSELTGLADVQNVTPFEAIIDNVKMGLGKKCDQVFYNDVAGQFEFKIGDTTYTFGLSPVEYDADGISVYVDYNYDMPINYTSIKEAAEDILDKCDKKVSLTSQSNDDVDDDTMEYTVYDVVEDEGRLCAKCMNESTNSFEDIKLGKVNSDAVNELLNNILNNPNYKLTDECKRKIADNSAPWGIVMSPSFDITASNALMSTEDFGGSVSFGESEQCTFENGDRVTDGERKGTVIDYDSIKVLVDWDYSETDDIEWVSKEDLSFIDSLKESTQQEVVDQCFNNNSDKTLSLSESYVSGRYVWFDYNDIKDVRPDPQQIIDAYNSMYPNYSDPLRDIQQVDFAHSNYAEKELHYLVTDNLGNKFWAIVGNAPEDKLKQISESYKDDIDIDEAFDVDDIVTSEQEFSSAATSINSTKLPAIYSMVNFRAGDVVVDFGGGKFDNAVNYLKDKDVTLLVYDPYNRSAEHNKEVLRILKEHGGADAAVNSNVLNVIKEPEAREAVLRNIKKITKSGAPVYITVYEGKGDGAEGATKSGYQLNRKTQDYMEEIQEVFPDAKRKGKLITAHNTSGNTRSISNSKNTMSEDVASITSSTEIRGIIKKAISGDKNSIKYLRDQGYKVKELVNPLSISEVGTYEITDTSGNKFNYDNTIINAMRESINMRENINTDADNIEKGYTAPVMTSLVAKAKELEKRVEEYKDSNDKAVFDRLLPSFKDNILNYKSEVEKDIKDFDEYWKIHKKAMMDNISEADSILKKIGISELSSKVEKLQESYSDDDFIDEMWEAVKDVSGIQDISQGKKPNTYLVTFDSEGSVTARARILLKAFIRANVDIELDSTNGSNVFTFIRPVSDWEFVKGKMIKDSDGFLTSYDWYRNTDSGVNIFMLGYDEADPDYADWETESDTEAEDWFNSYTGFEDDEDEIDESLDESYSVKDVKEFLDEVGGYTDYDGKVEELMHYFGMTKEQAESAIQDCVTSADDEIEESVSSSATAEVISNELKSAAYKLFKTPRWGFETDKEIKDYINPFFDVSEDPKTGDLEVQVRAELDYDNLVDLSNALDKVVSKYDKDAYFEAEQPGIITAVISYS